MAVDIVWSSQYAWPTLDAAASHGIVGDIIRAITPETEADPAAMLFTSLAVIGNVIGPGRQARVGDDSHPGRLNVVIAGDSSSGAKGTSLSAVRPIFRSAYPTYFRTRTMSGFGSGEAIVAEYVSEETDRRGLILEHEFARILTVANRDGSTLSPIIRNAWDGNPLEARRAEKRIVAEFTHISVIGHITPTELRTKIAENDVVNGFANRFLYVMSKRSKKLPSGGNLDPAVVEDLATRLAAIVPEDDSRVHVYHRSPEAEELWNDLYLAEPERDGTIGSLTARAHAQKLRIAVIYAALDCAAKIQPVHLRAAQAVWTYAVQSAEFIFGDARGDRTQDILLGELRRVYPEPLTGAQQDALFKSNLQRGKLPAARAALESAGLARTVSVPPGSKGGRPTVNTYAVPPDPVCPVNPVDPLNRYTQKTVKTGENGDTRYGINGTTDCARERVDSTAVSIPTEKPDLTEQLSCANRRPKPEISARPHSTSGLAEKPARNAVTPTLEGDA